VALDVLIVDSSAAIRKILQRVLRQAELPLRQVHEAADGPEALEKLRTETVSLVLANINLPNMDGLELLAQIKGSPAFKHVPVIMLATEGNRSKVMVAAQLGAAGYVCKPFTASQIQRTLSGLG